MKKLILSVTAIAGFSAGAFAQQIALTDNNNNTNDIQIGGVASTSDINVELLYGTSAGNYTTPVVTLLLSSTATSASSALGQTLTAVGDNEFGTGILSDPSGNAYTLPSTGTLYFELLGWTGTYSSYSAAVASGKQGVYAGSSTFSEANAGGGAPPEDVSAGLPLVLTQVTAVPEPSTLAMAGVGLASMLIFRRKNK